MLLDRILVVNLNQIGAVVMTTPVFKALKDVFPNAYIATLVRESVAPLLYYNPYLDEIITWEKRWSFRHKLSVVKEIRRRRFDCVINCSHSFERGILTWLSGAKVRVGFNTSEAAFLHNIRVIEKTGRYHAVERNLDLVRGLGVSVNGKDAFRLWITEAEKTWAREWFLKIGIGESEKVIGLNPGASNPLNRWMPEHFASLARMLNQRGYRVLLLGGKEDEEVGRVIYELSEGSVIYATGQFSLRELMAVLSCLDVVVTGDTGPMHIAVALNVPVVALFGPADPLWTGPYCGNNIIIQKEYLPCIRCLKSVCPFGKLCLKLITPKEVLIAIESLLSRRTKTWTG